MNWKLLLSANARTGRAFPISRVPLSIGRSQECDIVVPDTCVSRRHCQLLLVDDHPLVLDNGSRNGVYVNGERIAGRRELQAGDCIRVGNTVCLVTMSAGGESEAEQTSETEADSGWPGVVYCAKG